jgi:hypothetical protein
MKTLPVMILAPEVNLIYQNPSSFMPEQKPAWKQVSKASSYSFNSEKLSAIRNHVFLLKISAKRNRANNFDSSGVPRIVTPSTGNADKKADEAQTNQDEVHPWRRPASLRTRPTPSAFSSTSTASSNKLSPKVNEEDDVQLRRVHSFESDEK